jgi:light-independent protochlorophyllide reductase subunit B
VELTLWTYEGPPHVGAIRVAASMRDVHLMLHSPQGDTYADLLFTMIERDGRRPPVTYTTFQARDLGSSTAEIVIKSLREAAERYKPQVLMVADSCTAELIQDQPGALALGADLPVPVISLEMAAYTRKENWGAAETFYQLVRGLLSRNAPAPGTQRPSRDPSVRPSVNLLGPTKLGFRCRDDVVEVERLLNSMGVDVNVVAPLGASPQDLLSIPNADANVNLCPEVSDLTCSWLARTFGMPTIKTIPMGWGATRDFIAEVAATVGIEVNMDQVGASRLPWYSRSIDSTYLTGKRVFVFADGSHAVAAARVARDEMGFEVVGIGTYSRERARDVRAAAKEYGLEALITDNYLEVEARVQELQPEMVLGTQMERHIAKRLGIPCAVISTPAHVQDYPARYSPQMGFEGANVLFDTWVHPLIMGLEEHLLHMFRDDFEFNDSVGPSHLGSEGEGARAAKTENAQDSETDETIVWAFEAEKELKKIPFFVRGKARRNTEKFAEEQGLSTIEVDTLYDAKAHFSN